MVTQDTQTPLQQRQEMESAALKIWFTRFLIIVSDVVLARLFLTVVKFSTFRTLTNLKTAGSEFLTVVKLSTFRTERYKFINRDTFLTVVKLSTFRTDDNSV